MFKEFALEILFDISTTKGIDKGKLAFCENGEYDFVGRQVDNYGIQGTLNALNFPANPKNTFSLVQVGNSLARFRERAWYASQNIFILKPTDNRIIDNHLYFEAILNKIMSKYGDGYSNYPTLKSLELELIKLPVIESPDPSHAYTVDDIDWQYMRDYIAELERDYIAELDAYLKATGLDDYELTDEDKEVLTLYKESSASDKDDAIEAPMFKEFVVDDVLNIEQTKSVVAKQNLIAGDIPYVTRTVSDNGYSGTCGNSDKLNTGNCITIGAETGVAFYQPNDFVAGNKIYRLSHHDLSDKEYLYLAGVLNKQTSNYSYSNARIPSKIADERITLPVIESPDPSHVYTVDDIDWDFMKRYIRVIEKQTIADVVRFRDRELAVTRHVVGVA